MIDRIQAGRGSPAQEVLTREFSEDLVSPMGFEPMTP